LPSVSVCSNALEYRRAKHVIKKVSVEEFKKRLADEMIMFALKVENLMFKKYHSIIQALKANIIEAEVNEKQLANENWLL
jgi:hypothetical protein